MGGQGCRGGGEGHSEFLPALAFSAAVCVCGGGGAMS